MTKLVYINGEIVPYQEAKVGIEDRGYQFADGIYEVIVIYEDRPFKFEEHFVRLKKSAEGLDLNYHNYTQLKEDAKELIKKSQFSNIKLYIQITRGVTSRNHAYPDEMFPNVVMTVDKLKGKPDYYYQEGVEAITVPDERWSRCNIKSISLLPNILAKKKAKKAGAYEAIQIRDGFITDGTSSNVFIVKNEKIITPPATNYLLNGITRRVVIEEADRLDFEVQESSVSLYDLLNADEVFLTGTTTEIMPIINIDGRAIGSGSPGEYTRALYQRYQQII
jgi:D-alanine transaminase